jgi:hypothetical protein
MGPTPPAPASAIGAAVRIAAHGLRPNEGHVLPAVVDVSLPADPLAAVETTGSGEPGPRDGRSTVIGPNSRDGEVVIALFKAAPW